MTSVAAISLSAPALLLATGFVLLPIVAHLLTRRSTQRIIFPTIELLRNAAAGRSSVFMLRRRWLLLLRCLAVLALVLAFARPVWLTAEAQRAGADGVAVVFLLDCSASSGQLTQGVTALAELKALSLEQLDVLVPGRDHANLVTLGDGVRAAFNALSTNMDELCDALNMAQQTAARADPVSALSLCARLLDGHPGPRRLVIASDLQETHWGALLDPAGQGPRLPDGTEVTLLTPSGAPPANLAVQAPRVLPARPRVGQESTVRVTVVNHSGRVQPVMVNATANGEPLVPKSLTLEPYSQADVGFQATFDRPGDHRVTFGLSPDGLPSDNLSYRVVRVVEQIPIVLITGGDPDMPGTAGYYLSRAIAPYGSEQDTYAVTHHPDNRPLVGVLGRASSVIVGPEAVLSSPDTQSLHEYIAEGGGAVFFCGDPAGAQRMQVIDQLGSGEVLPWLPRVLRDHREVPGLVLGFSDSDPSMARLLGDQAGAAFDQIEVHQSWVGDPVRDGAAVLFQYSDGTPALATHRYRAGSVAVANFSPAPGHSGLGRHGLFVALVQHLAEWAQPVAGASSINTIGQTLSVTAEVAIDADGPTPQVTGPDGQPVQAYSLLMGQASAVFNVIAPGAPGFYTAWQGDTLLAESSVNLDERESDLRVLDPDALIHALAASSNGVETIDGASPSIASAEGVELWGWLILMGAGLLACEMFLIGGRV